MMRFLIGTNIRDRTAIVLTPRRQIQYWCCIIVLQTIGCKANVRSYKNLEKHKYTSGKDFRPIRVTSLSNNIRFQYNNLKRKSNLNADNHVWLRLFLEKEYSTTNLNFFQNYYSEIVSVFNRFSFKSSIDNGDNNLAFLMDIVEIE